MAITVVQTADGAGAASAVTAVFGSNVTPGNLIVVGAIESQPTAATWTSTTMSGTGGTFTVRGSPARGLATDYIAQSGDTATVTVNQSASAAVRILAAELSGMNNAAPFDQANGTTYGSATNTAVPMSGAIAQADEYVMAIVGQNGANGGDVSATDSFTLYTATTDTRRTFATRITSSVVTPNPTITWTTARAGQFLIAAWKMAAVGTGIPSLVMAPQR